MVRTDLLRGKIAQQGLSQRKLANLLGITDKTFYAKMKKGVFSTKEIVMMMKLLDFDDPREIFFAPDIARCETLQQKSKKGNKKRTKTGLSDDKKLRHFLWAVVAVFLALGCRGTGLAIEPKPLLPSEITVSNQGCIPYKAG